MVVSLKRHLMEKMGKLDQLRIDPMAQKRQV
jgi:hypothetical protein